MKRALLVLCALLLAALAAGAAPLTVAWSEGQVDIQKGGGWAELSLGDKLDSASKIRLAEGASVELSDGKRKVAITAAGTYVVDTLLKKGALAAQRKAGALDKLGRLVDPKSGASSGTVAAVRGAAVEPAKDSVTWVSDTTDVAAVMEEGRRLVREGDFATAALRFDDAAFASEGEEKDAARYAQAWALAADDSSAQAVKVLREMPSEGTWAGPRDRKSVV